MEKILRIDVELIFVAKAAICRGSIAMKSTLSPRKTRTKELFL
jgi:hypothetical protein